MSTGLFIEVGYRYPFGPNISDCVVLVNLDDASESRAIEITMPNLAEIQITSVLSALRRFFEGEQFRSIDFDKGEMLVEHRDKADYVSFVPARGGLLREDGIVEFAYDGPHK